MVRRVSGVGLAVLLAALAMGLAACGSDDDAGATDRGGPLDGRWVLAQYTVEGSLTPAPDGLTVDAAFAGGRLTGQGPVNTYRGDYDAAPDGALTLGPIATTQKAGPPAAMAAEAAYLAALESATSYASDGDTLTLYAQSDEPVLVYDADTVGITGAWEVTGYNNGKNAVVSLIPGSTVTADFAADGTLTGSAGVNTYRAGYETTPAAGITITPPATTRKGGSPELLAQEGRYLVALESARTFSIQGDTLTLRDADDAIAVTMTRR